MKDKATMLETSAEASVGAVISVGDDKFATLAADLAEIRKENGVFGYILRSGTSAIVDLAENGKLSQCALFSYQIQESGCNMAKQFNLANVENIVVECKKLKVLCVVTGENRIEVFLDKNSNHTAIAEKLRR